MNRAKILSWGLLVAAALGLAVGAAMIRPADAQVYPACPYGYYFDPTYGCLPLNYFYGPPSYVYPGYSFGFFYGGHWGDWHRGHPAPRGGAPHGGAHRR